MIPVGTIVAWNSTDLPPVFNNIQNWAFCDGTNGTPDLRGRFVLGANPIGSSATTANFTERQIGTIGGEEKTKLTNAQMPAHKHVVDLVFNPHNTRRDIWSNLASFWGIGTPVWDGKTYGVLGSSGSLSSTPTVTMQEVGGGGDHNNMPPFKILTYIMKIL